MQHIEQARGIPLGKDDFPAFGNFQLTLWPALLLLLIVFFFFEVTTADLTVQDFFFNFSTGEWMVDRNSPFLKWIVYDGAKKAIEAFAVFLLVLMCGPRRWLDFFHIPDPARRRLLVVILTLATVPALVGFIKHRSYVACPWDIQRYGGDLPYLRVMEPYAPGSRPDHLTTSFPAAHPSGGFALLALAGLAETRRRKRLGIAIGLGMGTIMGLYQMAKGAHYLSHVLITGLLAWIGFLVLHKLVVGDQRRMRSIVAQPALFPASATLAWSSPPATHSARIGEETAAPQ